MLLNGTWRQHKTLVTLRDLLILPIFANNKIEFTFHLQKVRLSSIYKQRSSFIYKKIDSYFDTKTGGRPVGLTVILWLSSILARIEIGSIPT